MFHAAAVEQVAEELKEIADRFEYNVVAEAAENLRRNFLTTTSDVSLTCN